MAFAAILLETRHFQNDLTKLYLSGIRDGDVRMPEGPVFLNPCSIWGAAVSEVITQVSLDFFGRVSFSQAVERLPSHLVRLSAT